MDFLNFQSDDSKNGFRLASCELLNWGTFNNIINIPLEGENGLLTGNVGSGKSTIVDAVTTLLVPHNRITYNKAAGSEKKERTILSYIRGEFRSEKNEQYGSSRAVYLRDESDYSVILGHFYNSGFLENVTLAVVFHMRSGSIEKFFVTSEEQLTIEKDFTRFGTDIKELRKRLRANDKTKIFDTFSEYSSAFRSVFGIKSEKALDLFHHTVSLKSIGNLTSFVRDNMLEKEDIRGSIDELLRNYDNLTASHEAVTKAESQLEMLTPLITLAGEYEDSSEEYRIKNDEKTLLPLVLIEKQQELITVELEKTTVTVNREADKLNALKEEQSELDNKRIKLIQAIHSDNDSLRLNSIELEIERTAERKTDKIKKAENYKLSRLVLGLPDPADEKMFYGNLEKVAHFTTQYQEKSTELEKNSVECGMEIAGLRQKLASEEEELSSLRRRATQIPLENIRLRNMIASSLAISEEELPFAAELLRIKPGCEEWEGAVERVLHNFGLSILVPEKHYMTVSRFINTTDLKSRIIYYKVPADSKKITPPSEKNSLYYKIDIKNDYAHGDWLSGQISERFNFTCCENIDEFSRYAFALTKSGLTKTGGSKHEKDDRKNIADRRNYILGWDNKRKIRLLEDSVIALKKELEKLEIRSVQLRKDREELTHKNNAATELAGYPSWNDINFQPEVRLLRDLEQEKKKILASSNRLKELNDQLVQTKKELQASKEMVEEQSNTIAVLNNEIKKLKLRSSELLEQAANLKKIMPDNVQELYMPLSDKINARMKKEKSGLAGWDNFQTTIQQAYFTETDALAKEIGKLSAKLIKMMLEFKNRYQDETRDIAAEINFISEYRKMYERITGDDLPRFRERFRELLREKTIHGIALFKQRLESFAYDITVKIDQINRSLRDIEYNNGTYIVLETDPSTDEEIRTFRSELKHCLEFTSGASNDLYNEEKFLQVQKVLAQFQNDTLASRIEKVTDVRNWFLFSARERWISDNSEKEFYSDSSGKSGGQKEKLAYTILASALAYQFGLEWNATKSRSFRFAVIDEAFSRGSDDSVRYGLELFRKLHLQLLLITPLQKIHVIEDYVSSIHIASNNDEGSSSQLQTITIEEHLAKRKEFMEKKHDNAR